MTPGLVAILRRAHDNGGTVRLLRVGEAQDFIKCCQANYLRCVTEPVKGDRFEVYVHHLLTDQGREALINDGR